MTIVTSYDFESETWTHHTAQTDARQAFRQAVSAIAAKAKETLPECHGRVDAAVKLVLAGDVELLEGGTANVASQSHGQTTYFVVNGTCACRDFPKAPSGWCKHRIAAGLAKRVATRVRTPLDAPANGQAPAPSQPTPAPAGPSTPLPEAPASVNCYVTLGGRQVQVTLRGTDEREVLARLEAVLARYPLPTPTADAPAPSTPAPAGDAAPTCPAHGVRLHPSTKRAGSWYCPVRDQATGQYCREKR
jgi:hypothetical protein